MISVQIPQQYKQSRSTESQVLSSISTWSIRSWLLRRSPNASILSLDESTFAPNNLLICCTIISKEIFKRESNVRVSLSKCELRPQHIFALSVSQKSAGEPPNAIRINLSLVIELTDINNFVSYWEFYRKLFLASKHRIITSLVREMNAKL